MSETTQPESTCPACHEQTIPWLEREERGTLPAICNTFIITAKSIGGSKQEKSLLERIPHNSKASDAILYVFWLHIAFAFLFTSAIIILVFRYSLGSSIFFKEIFTEILPTLIFFSGYIPFFILIYLLVVGIHMMIFEWLGGNVLRNRVFHANAYSLTVFSIASCIFSGLFSELHQYVIIAILFTCLHYIIFRECYKNLSWKDYLPAQLPILLIACGYAYGLYLFNIETIKAFFILLWEG